MNSLGLEADVELMVRQTFLQEAEDLLVAAEEGFLALERDPTDSEVVARIFRVAHTFKGSALSVGFQGIGRFSHWLEAVLDLVRKGQTRADESVMTALLRGLDCLKLEVSLLRNDMSGGKLLESDADFLKKLFEERTRTGNVESNQAGATPGAGVRADDLEGKEKKAKKTSAGSGPNSEELARTVGLLFGMRKASEEVVVERKLGHDDSPVYALLSARSLAVPMDAKDVEFYGRLSFEHENRQLAASQCEGFAQMALGALSSHVRYVHVGRVCVAQWVGITHRLQVIDSACAEPGVPNTMPKGYSCYVRNESSLAQLDAGNQRLIRNTNDVLKCYHDRGNLPQRSLRRLHSAGLRSGLALPLRASGRIAGFLFLNSPVTGYFEGLTVGEVQTLLALRLLAESHLLECGLLPDADYFSAFIGKASLPHESFRVSLFVSALEKALARMYAQSPAITVSASENLRFFHSTENSAYALARVLSGFAGFAHEPRHISVHITHEADAVRFKVEPDFAGGSKDEHLETEAIGSHPLARVATMCGFKLFMSKKSFTLEMEYDEPEGTADYTC